VLAGVTGRSEAAPAEKRQKIRAIGRK
jgi:hypothetical protein